MLGILRAWVPSSLYYACAVWCDSRPAWLKKVRQFHYNALMKTLGVKCTPRAADLFKSCGWDMPTIFLHKALMGVFCRTMYHVEQREAYGYIQAAIHTDRETGAYIYTGR